MKRNQVLESLSNWTWQDEPNCLETAIDEFEDDIAKRLSKIKGMAREAGTSEAINAVELFLRDDQTKLRAQISRSGHLDLWLVGVDDCIYKDATLTMKDILDLSPLEEGDASIIELLGMEKSLQKAALRIRGVIEKREQPK